MKSPSNGFGWKQKLRVAMAQIDPVKADIEANIDKHIDFIQRARKEKADIVVFPELSLTGYDIGPESTELALEFDSLKLNRLVESTEGLSIVFGMVELGFAAQLHNSAVVVQDRSRSFIHRKLNLPNYGSLEEGKHFATGRYIESFQLSRPWFGGIMICSDAWNPALVHLTAVKGATLLFVPICSAKGTTDHEVYSNPEGWDLMCRFYSYAYGIPAIVVNRVGQEGNFQYWGGSFAYSPLGEILHRCGADEELAIVEVDHYQVVRARKALPTVRDSNLDLITREVERSRNQIGYPSIIEE